MRGPTILLSVLIARDGGATGGNASADPGGPGPIDATGASAPSTPLAQAPPFQAQTLATFDSPWAMAFLPNGGALVTEAGAHKRVLAGD